jgi:hypothetical protein
MNNRQESKAAMYYVSRDFLILNEPIVNSLPKGSMLLNSLKTCLNGLTAAKNQQAVNNTGIVIDKNSQKQLIAEASTEIKDKILAYAGLEDVKGISQKINFSESDLRRASDSTLIERCFIIEAIGREHVAKMEEYHLTIEELDALNAMVKDFEKNITTPRITVTEKSVATKRIEELIKEIDGILSKIDLIVNTQKKIHPIFYKHYQKVRKVVMLQGSSLKVKAHAFDHVTKEGIKGVLFVPEQNQQQPNATHGRIRPILIKKTANKGSFHVKSIPSGNYTVTISKPGYESQVITVYVADNELTIIEVFLVRNT